MVVLAHSAVLSVPEKTTLRAAFMMPVNGWSAVGKADRRDGVRPPPLSTPMYTAQGA